MIYWYIFAGLIVLGLIYMRFEAGFLKVEEIKFTKSKKGLKIIQLSDIHVPFLRVPVYKVRNIIESEKPDIVILTGDYIHKPKQVPEFLDFLEEIVGSHRTFLCLGNHDYEAFLKNSKGLQDYLDQIKCMGVEVLHNQSVCFEKASTKYTIIGIADMRFKNHDVKKALESCCSEAAMNIAFSHNPDIVLEIPKSKVDYLLCGHFHGGQIWAPFDLEFKILRDEKLCKMGIKRGLHKLNGINLYISRGLGNVCFPFRFLSRPEITVFYLP